MVDATHNDLLIAVMSALSSAVYDGTEIEQVNSLPVRSEVARAHDSVVDAIRAGDADAARRRMHRHVRAFRERATSLDLQISGAAGHGTSERGLQPEQGGS